MPWVLGGRAIIGLAVAVGGLQGQDPWPDTTQIVLADGGVPVTMDHWHATGRSRATLVLPHKSASSRGEIHHTAPRLAKAEFDVLAVDLHRGGVHRSSRVLNATAARFGTDTILVAVRAGDSNQI